MGFLRLKNKTIRTGKTRRMAFMLILKNRGIRRSDIHTLSESVRVRQAGILRQPSKAAVGFLLMELLNLCRESRQMDI